MSLFRRDRRSSKFPHFDGERLVRVSEIRVRFQLVPDFSTEVISPDDSTVFEKLPSEPKLAQCTAMRNDCCFEMHIYFLLSHLSVTITVYG